jgi:formiminoglutamase
VTAAPWLVVERRDAPFIVSIPHAGVDLGDQESRFVGPWRARRDTDWHLAELYGFAASLGATIVRTRVSRSIIDVNRDPSGASLYPGQATTGLCPTTTFDGELLYRDGVAPSAAEIAARREAYFVPYHSAVGAEIARLRHTHPRVALYDAHSIRSRVPRLFDGELPQFNLGTHSGRACSPVLRETLAAIIAESGHSYVVDGRFKGGWITRSFGRPGEGVDAIQMELGCRGYMAEPEHIDDDNWPTPFDPQRAAAILPTLRRLLEVLLVSRPS